MITEKDLQEAIAECQGVKNPTSNTCIKLAAFLIIREHLFGEKTQKESEPVMPRYSFASGNKIFCSGDSEFAQLVNGKNQDDVMPVLEELVETIRAINPRLYAGVIRKLQ